MYGPCRSAIGGGRALTPPSRRCLGGLLPRQLADSPRAFLEADCSFRVSTYRELVPLSRDYARLQGKYLRITTPSATPRSFTIPN